MRAELKHCQSCRAPIWWAVTIHGKSTPMNASPHEKGGWVVDGETDTGAPIVRKVDPLLDDPEELPRFDTHWATCPNADQHRKR